jgi:hypothetical protein
MASSAVDGTDANAATLNKGLPTAQTIAEVAITQQLVGVLLAHIRKAALGSEGRRLGKKYGQQQ